MNTLPKRSTGYAGVPGFDVSDPPPWTKPAPDRSLLDNFELIQDLARYGEGLFTRDQVKKKWRKLISNEMWNELGNDDAIVDAIAKKITATNARTATPTVRTPNRI